MPQNWPLGKDSGVVKVKEQNKYLYIGLKELVYHQDYLIQCTPKRVAGEPFHAGFSLQLSWQPLAPATGPIIEPKTMFAVRCIGKGWAN